MTARHLSIDLGQTGQVSALLVRPQAARACYVLAHGAGMAHHFMEEVASGLAALGSASLHRVEAADHPFHVPARSGRTDREVMTEILDTVAAWVRTIVA